MMKKPNQQAGNDIPVNNAQYGGTILGFILGLGAGLGIAFVIAFYLSKNTPQERPGVRAPNLPMTIKPSVPVEGEVSAEIEVPTEGPGKDPIGEVPVEVEDPTKTLSAPNMATHFSNMLDVEIKPPSTGSPFSPGEIALIQTFIQMCNSEDMGLDSIQECLGLGSTTLLRSSSAMSVYVARMGKGY